MISGGVTTPGLAELREYGIHVLPIPMPFPVTSVNIYFIETPVPTLVDAPPKGDAFMTELDRALQKLGFRISDVQRIFVTHPHIDHCGSAQEIVDRSGAEVWIYRPGAKAIEDYESEFHETIAFFEELLKMAGVSPEQISPATQFFRYLKQFGGKVKHIRCLDEDEEIKLSSFKLRVIPVPGHTPFCTLFYEPDREFGFTGDFLLKDISSNPLVQRPSVVPRGYNSLKLHISSLRKVRDMGIRAALTGHGDIIRNPSQRIQELLSFIGKRKKRVLQIVETGDHTPFQISTTLFGRLKPDQILLAISEVMAHLEILEEEGLVERRKGITLFFSRKG